MADLPSSLWHQIVIKDPEGLSGASVSAFVIPIVSKVGATVIAASDLVGACPGLLGYEKRLLTSADFLQKVTDAIQYDWAFFFLYSKSPEQETIASDDRAAMANADATVRLADDYYFYVYSRDQGLMSDLRRKYPDAEYKASTFEDLDIPY